MKHLLRLTLILLIVLPILSDAQNNVDIGFALGLSTHGSDANSWGRHGQSLLENTKIAYGFNLAYGISSNVSLRLQYRGTQIEGDDSNLEDKAEWGAQHFARDFMYRSNIKEFGAMVEYAFPITRQNNLQTKDAYSYSPRVLPYVTAGLALTIIDDDENFRDWGNPPSFRMNDVLLDQAEGSVGGLQFPIGLGIRIELSEYAFTDLFYTIRLPVSDYLDGISEAANPDKNDSYQIFGINVGLRLKVTTGDSDGDGVKDKDDECPDIPGSRLLFGCPDFDGDGIMDDYDNCPQIAGPAKTFGCPDRDEDGIPDHKDECPTQKGELINNGCPDRKIKP